MSRTNLVIGSRASPLAVAQAEEVRGLLTGHDNTLHVSLLKLDTVGDRNLNVSLAELSRLESQTDTPPAAAAPSGHLVPPKPAGEKDLWTRELDAALHRGDAHVLVHSLKDLPTTGRTGALAYPIPHSTMLAITGTLVTVAAAAAAAAAAPFTLAAVPQRFDPYDALVLRADAPPPAGLPAAALVPADPNAVDDPQTQYAGVKIDLREVLPRGSVIGTSSLRRAAQLSHRYGDHFTFKVVRGNIATRLGKLDAPSGGYDALILAAAGLRRLGPDFASRISVRLRDERYAVGQGALGVEVAATDGSALALVQVACEDAGSRWRVEAERYVTIPRAHVHASGLARHLLF
ncbi:hypothetical protein H696_05189 [Fonticula alba]|uniref:hydroxymethylbilane synthase n=1 Tax=Fonticula alba TaxID=691883 RepID=A0A058Z402_FONAL|nr:hypothetical protein H696_05189 [Fonticula alba]KCV68267.1 hypothetical protein H696_05189 [Fonticula alba]|eukprot:XP_009497321.1 hypothetical protein H696_05189 [Fonticula alba]